MSRTIRPIRIDGNTAYITLTKGYIASVSVCDVEKISGRNWYAHVGNWGAYAVSRINGKLVRMHRLIMDCPEGLEVDHKDGNGLNNQRLNLRLATSAENKCNKLAGSNNTSGFKGVCLYKPNNKWRAYITKNGKQHSLGYYSTKEEARAAYIAAMHRFHGEFAKA